MNSPKSNSLLFLNKWNNQIGLALIILISVIAYLPVIHGEFLNWDDNSYIKDNSLITSFNLKDIFTTFVLGNYHPFTVLVYAVEYQFFGLNSSGYHFLNLLLHTVNIVLVFYMVFLLCDKAEIALITSLLFGIHPLHVESVAWISELKDLLYCMFFLASCVFYLKFLKDPKRKYYLITLLFFLFSLLSKAMAASLPLVLLLIDYLKERRMTKEVLIEKIPFFLLSLIFGIVAISAQKSSNYVELGSILSLPQRLVFACYGFISYLIKLLLPLNLSAFYTYPEKEGGIYIPSHFFLYVLSFIALAGYLIYTRRFTKKLLFGLGFFTFTIILVLQLLPVGKAIMADRYSYIPSIGIFYLAAEGFSLLWLKKQRITAVLVLSLFTVLFSIQTYSRSGDWKNDTALWKNEIKSYLTEGSPTDNLVKPDKAKSIEGHLPEPSNAQEYFERGTTYARERKNEEAINDFNKSIELDPTNYNAYQGRGIILVNQQKNEDAIRDFSKAIDLKPDFSEAFNNRGFAYLNLKRYEEAIRDFNQAIEYKPNYALAFHNRGNVYFEEKSYEAAIQDFSKAIELNQDLAQAYYKRGLSKIYLERKEAACADLEKAFDLGYFPAAEAISRNCKSIILKRDQK